MFDCCFSFSPWLEVMLLRILSVDGELFSGQITMVQCPTENGYLTILPGHMNLVAPLLAGQIRYTLVDTNEHKTVLETFQHHEPTLTVQAGMLMIDHDLVVIVLEDM